MDQDAFDRLPADVKQATLARQRQQEEQAAAYVLRLQKRMKFGAILGGAASFILGIVGGGANVFYLLVMVLAGALAAFFTIRLRAGHLAGMLLFGGSTVAAMLLCTTAGIAGTDPFSLFCSWIFLIGTGALLGAKAEQDRTKNDTF